MNIGILAHVDAGKTSLTERLLLHAGVIDRLGSVDAGSTQTDSLELERRRGITIQSAVVSFTVRGQRVNLIDTPGHSDFVAEVERALRVLDGAVLVVSAVEGVQAQTRVLMRTLRGLGTPVIVFVNKVDRAGARYEQVLAELRELLGLDCVAMNSVSGLGTRDASVRRFSWHDKEFLEQLALADERLLASYVDDPVRVSEQDCLRALRGASPVYFGSAVTGVGVAELVDGVLRLLRPQEPTTDALRASVFKVERGRAGEKVAYARVHTGVLRARSVVPLHRRDPSGAVLELTGRVTGVEVFEHGAATVPAEAGPGRIAKVRGLREVRVGDQLGSAEPLPAGGFFAPPRLETVVRAPDRAALHEALRQLAEQDPLINLSRHADGEMSVRLYGEVQKEVIADTLAETFGVLAEFEPTSTVFVERPVGVGEAVEEMDFSGRLLFYATVGLRVQPAPPGSGVSFQRAVELGGLPLAFHKAIEESVRDTLRQGLHGWEVVDCAVTLTRTGYASPISAAGDFRKLTPLVLMQALRQAGTTVLEPLDEFEAEVPADCANPVLLALAECGAQVRDSRIRAATCVIGGVLPTSAVHGLEQRVPALTRGEGVVLSRFHGHRPYRGPAPHRPRTGANPLDRGEYLLHTFGRG
ncbi:GTP-binding protein [Kutzneria albida]|uniref:Oxytetracycline resistance protein n=1 Tax=Kutzneria albida DSM 43870 TaxID=1449976 RepID=W5W185_9PSEU|nr:GTP-binding protein [Kutzneria albida]AHH94550.1 Oxytetracycline resistance protein [Kutzneria albida DSM 43870]